MRLLDTGRKVIRNTLEKVGRGWSHVQERKPLAYDLLEGDDGYLVVFDAPGVRGEDVQVRFVDDTVEVSMDRPIEDREGYRNAFPGRGRSLAGSASLPRDADVTTSGANATLTRSGTLEVEIPKSDGSTDREDSDDRDNRDNRDDNDDTDDSDNRDDSDDTDDSDNRDDSDDTDNRDNRDNRDDRDKK